MNLFFRAKPKIPASTVIEIDGAPIRLRIERALGYKQPKYLHTIELVDDLTPFGKGKGGYWPDQGYDWYGGI